MTNNPTIFVDGKPFMGRVEEQKQFRSALNEILTPPSNENLPYVFMLYGDGGIGKTALAKRFRDIAMTESPFEHKFQILWIDWEIERKRFSGLQVGREYITPETVLSVMYTVAQRQDLGKYFVEFKKTLDSQKRSEKKVIETLASSGEKDEFTTIRTAGADTIAKILRTSLPLIGDTGEKLAQSFLAYGIKYSAEKAAQTISMLDSKLKGSLSSTEYELFLYPTEHLITSFANGLKKISMHKPLIVILDTYEIVNRVDIWTRLAMIRGGPKLGWIIAGRDDLVDDKQFGAEYFKGYINDFPRRLISFNMKQLSLEDVRVYFKIHVPDRILNETDLDAIRRSTRGIPLAIEQAAELWSRGISIETILGTTSDVTPQREIVKQMTSRYLLHVITDRDKQTLYALALARGDIEILSYMLAPDDNSFNLANELDLMARNYASVYSGEARLHDEPALFFTQLLKEKVKRTSAEVKLFIARAIDILHKRLSKIEAQLALLEERAADEDWIKCILDLVYYKFWIDEDDAWKELIPHFVEGLAYNQDLSHGTLQIAEEWYDYLSNRGKKRVKILRSIGFQSSTSDTENGLLDELSQLAKLGWLNGDKEERLAILDFLKGRQLYRDKQFTRAMEYYEQTELRLPLQGEILRIKLGEELYKLANELIWPGGLSYAIFSEDAERILRKVAKYLPNEPGVWRRLGVVLAKGGKQNDAINSFLKAIELDDDYAVAYNGLGNAYATLYQYEKAMASYKKAIALDQQDPTPYYGLGQIYYQKSDYKRAIDTFRQALSIHPTSAILFDGIAKVFVALGRKEDAINTLKQAIQFDPHFINSYNSLGNIYKNDGRFEDAVKLYTRAIELDPKSASSYNCLGNALSIQGKYDSAFEAYQNAARISSAYATPFYGLGTLCRSRGEYSQAIVFYKRAIELNPSYATAYNGLGNVFFDLGQYDEAIAAYNRAIDIDNQYAYPYNGLGSVYAVLGYYERSVASYQKAIEIDPKCEPPKENLKAIELLIGQSPIKTLPADKLPDENVFLWEAPSQLSQNSGGNRIKIFGGIRADLNPGQSVQRYQNQVANNPDDYHAYCDLASAYHKLGKFDEATKAYLKAIEINPTFVYAYYELGNLFFEIGQLNDAVIYLEKGITIEPNLSNCHYALGKIYYALGKISRAIECCKQTIGINPNYYPAHLSLAACFQKTGLDKEYKAEIEILSETLSMESIYNQARFASITNQVDNALRLLKLAIKQSPKYRAHAQQDPEFEALRHNQAFKSVINSQG